MDDDDNNKRQNQLYFTPSACVWRNYTHTHSGTVIDTQINIFTPSACARGKVISLSVCRCCCRCCYCYCLQKIGIFRDLQLPASHEWHKTVKIGKKTYISVLIPAPHDPGVWFLYTMPIRHTYWSYYTIAHALCRYVLHITVVMPTGNSIMKS